jgi:hypothetical protein
MWGTTIPNLLNAPIELAGDRGRLSAQRSTTNAKPAVPMVYRFACGNASDLLQADTLLRTKIRERWIFVV